MGATSARSLGIPFDVIHASPVSNIFDSGHRLWRSCHAMSIKENVGTLPPWGNALAGASGAVLANAAIYPLDMCAVRES